MKLVPSIRNLNRLFYKTHKGKVVRITMASTPGNGLLGKSLFSKELATGIGTVKASGGSVTSTGKEAKKSPKVIACEGDFPLDAIPNPYSKQERTFGHRRPYGNDPNRKHAGFDLYGKAGSEVHAIKNGYLIEKPIRFRPSLKEKNPNIFAVVIDHGDFIGLYGEIVPEKGLQKNSPVYQGQVIGRIADQMGADMLHFEMYSKGAEGDLLTGIAGKDNFYRRSDLMNPTAFLNCLRKRGSHISAVPGKRDLTPYERIKKFFQEI